MTTSELPRPVSQRLLRAYVIAAFSGTVLGVPGLLALIFLEPPLRDIVWSPWPVAVLATLFLEWRVSGRWGSYWPLPSRIRGALERLDYPLRPAIPMYISFLCADAVLFVAHGVNVLKDL